MCGYCRGVTYPEEPCRVDVEAEGRPVAVVDALEVPAGEEGEASTFQTGQEGIAAKGQRM